jgi:hypothetical protein
MALLDIPVVETSGYEQTVSIAALKSIPVTGHVQPSADGVNLRGANVAAVYQARWLCGFFHEQDCLVPQWEVATASVGDDGSVRLMVPDFAADPVVTRWATATESGLGPFGPGGFTLQAHRSVAPHDYSLEHDREKFGLIAIAPEYSALLLWPRR